MSIYDLSLLALDGSPLDLSRFKGKTSLVVNVASRCGLTPQYAGLEQLHERFKARGFTVLGVPCNQFGGQEPGSAEEIATFCSDTYGITFPMTEKLDVNGAGRHPLYAELTATPDAEGQAGDVQWNFEKFLVAPDGASVARFRPQTKPDSDAVVQAVEALLAAED
ncbi:MAG TPA: glutathione peroxidase [Chloroflexota bacterium]|nr:glutathione peroxidase [Chloroflexota bacterium]